MQPNSRLDVLLRELRGACALRRGRKAELARYLGARPHQINQWLTSQTCRPSAEYVLGMLEWLGTLPPYSAETGLSTSGPVATLKTGTGS